MNSDHACSVLLGLACGDALGRLVEFRSAAQISSEYGRLDEMVGHGTWNQPAGTITDDTDQALCIARSLVEQQTFDRDWTVDVNPHPQRDVVPLEREVIRTIWTKQCANERCRRFRAYTETELD